MAEGFSDGKKTGVNLAALLTIYGSFSTNHTHPCRNLSCTWPNLFPAAAWEQRLRAGQGLKCQELWDWDLSSPGTVLRGVTPPLSCLGLKMHQQVQWALLDGMLFSEEAPKMIVLGEAGIHWVVSRVGLLVGSLQQRGLLC